MTLVNIIGQKWTTCVLLLLYSFMKPPPNSAERVPSEVQILWHPPQNEADMIDSFNRIYSKLDDPFYFGRKPSGELEKFLNAIHPPIGEALDLECGGSRNSLTYNTPPQHPPSLLQQPEHTHTQEMTNTSQ